MWFTVPRPEDKLSHNVCLIIGKYFPVIHQNQPANPTKSYKISENVRVTRKVYQTCLNTWTKCKLINCFYYKHNLHTTNTILFFIIYLINYFYYKRSKNNTFFFVGFNFHIIINNVKNLFFLLSLEILKQNYIYFSIYSHFGLNKMIWPGIMRCFIFLYRNSCSLEVYWKIH